VAAVEQFMDGLNAQMDRIPAVSALVTDAEEETTANQETA
jgi:oligoribonuclease (3'-5' exoribonuclease)